jgi:hypothetical protein
MIVMPITILLASALVSYGRPTVTWNVVTTASHHDRNFIPELRVIQPTIALGAATFELAKEGGRLGRPSIKKGGQIGRLLIARGGQIG